MSEHRYARALLLLCGLCVALALSHLFTALPGSLAPDVQGQIIWQLRLPQVLTAILVGAGLTTSAATLQIILANPLADPGIIGINSGASFVAAICLLGLGSVGLTLPVYWLPLACFIGALFSTLVIFLLARRIGDLSPAAVILAGIAVSTLLSAAIAWLFWVADAQSLRNLTFWLMGSLDQADLPLTLAAAGVMLPVLGYVMWRRAAFNLLYLGPLQARIHGINLPRFEKIMLLCSALLVGIAVSLAGSVAFIGLLVPHGLRQLVGHDHRYLLPFCALSGAALMLFVLWCSRLNQGMPLPVSLITASLGAPWFIWVLYRNRGSQALVARG